MIQFEYVPANEAKIARALVDAALAKGWYVSVNDGEETTVRDSRDREAILDAMGTTECDYLTFAMRTVFIRLGFVMLIWGNGEDVISDYSDTQAMRDLTAPFQS